MTPFEPIDQVEVLAMPKTKRASAMIRLARVEGGWTWAVDCARHHGDMLGHGEPLGRRPAPSRITPTRQEAIDAGIARIRRAIDEPDINAWLESLSSAQPDLFGEAA